MSWKVLSPPIFKQFALNWYYFFTKCLVELIRMKPSGPEVYQLSSVQSLSRVWPFATPWTAACQAFLSIINTWSKLLSIELVMPSNHLILCHPLILLPSIFPSNRVFSNESVLHIRWPRFWSFSTASVFPMNIQSWFPLGWTRWISLESKGLSRVFSNTTIKKHQLSSAEHSLWSNSHIHTWLLQKP